MDRWLQGKGVFGGYPRGGDDFGFGGVWVVCVLGGEFVFVGAASVLTSAFPQKNGEKFPVQMLVRVGIPVFRVDSRDRNFDQANWLRLSRPPEGGRYGTGGRRKACLRQAGRPDTSLLWG